MKTRFRLSEGSGKILMALALVSLLALPIFCLVPRHDALATARQHARLQGKDLKQRASAICEALGAVNPTVADPQFIVQKFQGQGLHGQRRLWTVECLAGPHQYDLIFNDLTGNLESVFSDGLTISSRAAAVQDVAVTNPAEAVEGSVRRLKDLQMTPKGTLITLAEPPVCDRDRITWHLTWKVKRPGTLLPYEVRMILNGNDATPMMVVNCLELETFTHN